MTRDADLRQLLWRYPPEDVREEQHRLRMVDLLDPAHRRRKLDPSFDAFVRSQYEPGHFTASAFILSPSGDELLLIYHSKLHRWLQPGGHVEPEDGDILAASRREAEEEVGLADLPLVFGTPFDLDIHTIPARKGQPEHEHFDVRFLFQAPTRAFTAGDDAAKAAWVSLTEINEADSDPSIMRSVGKLLVRAGA